MDPIRYVIVIPSKNEEKLLGKTLESIVHQTIEPVLCIVLDDGSTDGTFDIASEYANRYDYIKSVHLETNDEYKVGKRVVNLFNQGRKIVDESETDYDWIVKLDADISFSPNFIETIFNKIEPNYGVISGTPYYFEKDKRKVDYSPLFHSHGQFKIYNKTCLNAIGGLIPSLGWDCADNIIAIDKGWETKAFRDVFYEMHRKVGTKISNRKGRYNSGRGAYLLGYSKLYLLIKASYDSMGSSGISGSFYYLKGYLSELFKRSPKVLNKNQRRLLRKLFWKSFFERFAGGKFVHVNLHNKK